MFSALIYFFIQNWNKQLSLIMCSCLLFTLIHVYNTRGDQKVRGKVLLNRIALIDCNENS